MTLYTIKERRGTAADWALANPILEEGQWAVELDTGKAKCGDGIEHYNDLSYYLPESAIIDLIKKYLVLLEPGQGSAEVPVNTAVGALIARKA